MCVCLCMYVCVCVSVFLPSLFNMRCACALLYCNLCPFRVDHIFTHYVINDTSPTRQCDVLDLCTFVLLDRLKMVLEYRNM